MLKYTYHYINIDDELMVCAAAQPSQTLLLRQKQNYSALNPTQPDQFSPAVILYHLKVNYVPVNHDRGCWHVNHLMKTIPVQMSPFHFYLKRIWNENLFVFIFSAAHHDSLDLFPELALLMLQPNLYQKPLFFGLSTWLMQTAKHPLSVIHFSWMFLANWAAPCTEYGRVLSVQQQNGWHNFMLFTFLLKKIIIVIILTKTTSLWMFFAILVDILVAICNKIGYFCSGTIKSLCTVENR